MTQFSTKRYEFELEILADRPTVWATMINDIGEWWPADYRAGKAGSTFHFDARTGGSVWEKSETGGLEWFSVQALETESWVNLVGFTGPPWGGPSITMLRIDLTDTEGGSTLLRVTDASMGDISPSAEEGWRRIFGGLQSAVSQ